MKKMNRIERGCEYTKTPPLFIDWLFGFLNCWIFEILWASNGSNGYMQ